MTPFLTVIGPSRLEVKVGIFFCLKPKELSMESGCPEMDEKFPSNNVGKIN
jgi:hypothetical protein